MAQPCALTDFKKRLQMGYKMVTRLQKEVTTSVNGLNTRVTGILKKVTKGYKPIKEKINYFFFTGLHLTNSVSKNE